MNAWIESINYCSGTWFDVVSGVAIQSVFVFGFAWIAMRLLRNSSASLRFWIWQAAALKLLIIPFSVIVVLPLWPAPPVKEIATPSLNVITPIDVEQAESLVSYPLQQVASVPPIREAPRLTALAYMFGGWMLICWIQVVRCFRRRQRLSAFLKTCTPVSEEHRLRLQQLNVKLGLRKPVRLMRGEVQVPLVTGVGSATIILPSQQEFERGTFDQVVLHELAHVKRHDLFWVWLPEMLRMLFFFHPLAYWIQHQAKLDSEMACDELVLSLGSNRRDYAKTLLELASPAAPTY